MEEGVGQFVTTFASTLGIDADSADPTAVTEAAAAKMAALQETADKNARDLAIYRAAVNVNADEAKLADSKSFTNEIKALDPSSETYSADVAKAVAKAVRANPDFKSIPRLDRFGGDFSGGVVPTAKTDDTIEARIAERRKRRGVHIPS